MFKPSDVDSSRDCNFSSIATTDFILDDKMTIPQEFKDAIDSM